MVVQVSLLYPGFCYIQGSVVVQVSLLYPGFCGGAR